MSKKISARLILAIFSITLVTFGWQNCSQLQSSQPTDPLVYKIGSVDSGLAVLAPEPTSTTAKAQVGGNGTLNAYDPLPPPPLEENPPGQPLVLGEGCGIQVTDIIVNVDFLSAHKDDQGAALPLVAISGPMSLKDLAETGVEVTALGPLAINQIQLQLQETGNYIVAADGSHHPLAVLAAQQKPGIRLRIADGSAKISIVRNQTYLLQLAEIPMPKMFKANDCRLSNNLAGHLGVK